MAMKLSICKAIPRFCYGQHSWTDWFEEKKPCVPKMKKFTCALHLLKQLNILVLPNSNCLGIVDIYHTIPIQMKFLPQTVSYCIKYNTLLYFVFPQTEMSPFHWFTNRSLHDANSTQENHPCAKVLKCRMLSL